ncbi:MAG: dihydropteroate synthase [Alphaproteobacteria bacterium]|nr:dihydropteroate synthase [Alphaproteobacteria bacterium]
MPDRRYYRPLVQSGKVAPASAILLAGGPVWFTHVERLQRGREPEVISARELPDEIASALTSPRASICGLTFEHPLLMGVLNTTPDSFSDGGQFDGVEAAFRRGGEMIAQGADLIDIGGESTRPGAKLVDNAQEIARVLPVAEALHKEFSQTPLSIDTRKAEVASAVLAAGAGLVNDVSALEYDAKMGPLLAKSGAAICLMHAKGTPKNMQDAPRYDDVLLDVYDYLQGRIDHCLALGIARERILLDPGIGFGKTLAHNLALIRGLSLFHGLGCAILLGVSRKSFIGEIAREPDANARLPGSIAVGLEGLRQGVQMLRVHDIRETRQAVSLWQATR